MYEKLASVSSMYPQKIIGLAKVDQSFFGLSDHRTPWGGWIFIGVQTQYKILNYERNMVEKYQCGSVYSVANEHVIKFPTDKSYQFN